MGEQYLKALEEYEKVFDDSFPTIPMSGYTEDEAVEIINRCISEKKDVYDLGYLDMDTIY